MNEAGNFLDADETARIREIYALISEAAQAWEQTTLSHFEGQPYKALIASALSAQTREEHTLKACRSLFALADNPFDMMRLSEQAIAGAIHPVTYWRTKIGYVLDIARKVADNGGEVPRTVEELMQYKGVGWKVAVLTLEIGYDIHEDITVDVHVARISKRMGIISESVKQPKKINEALKAVMPREYWSTWNGLMVQFGRNMCLPRYPRCKTCLIRDICPKIGVDR
jgi:endonuclease-3